MNERPLSLLVPAEAAERDLWWAFGMEGISVSDDNSWLQEPAFGDATVCSREQVLRMIDGSVGVAEAMRKHTAWLVHRAHCDTPYESVAQHADYYSESHSFLLVRRRGAPDSAEVHTRAYARAREVAALLGLIAMTINDNAATFAMSAQRVDTRLGMRLAISAPTGQIVGLAMQPTRYYPTPIQRTHFFHLDREFLTAVFSMGFHRELWRVIIERDEKVSQGLRDAIRDATVRLFDAVHANSFEERLTSAITTLEILLSNGDPWARLETRASALMGPGVNDPYQIKELFRSRHNIVHSRGEVSPAQALKSIGLVLSALFNAAVLALRVRDRDRLHRYLDFVAAYQKSKDLFSDANAARIESALCLQSGIHIWPWLDAVDSVADSAALLPTS